ncbi:MAG: 2-oxoglutaramate amidase [Gammaproteobacteria bacterium]|nr:2-oxoglutaramate amidase [Gammaproteobacteria bacterium]
MCSSESVDENLQTAYRLIGEAAQQGARIVALPEMFALITDKSDLRLRARESFGQGKIQDFLAHTAQHYGIWLVGGTVPILNQSGDKTRAACLVYNDQGVCVARYDKIHLFDVVLSETECYRESDTVESGETSVVVETPFGRLGLAVCYDLRFPELFNELFKKGAEMLVLPSAFTVKTGEAHWHLLTRARAVDTFCYMLAPAQSGVHASGRQTYGHSIIVAPWGNSMAECKEEKSGSVCADINLEEIVRIRRAIPIGDYK